VELLGGKAELEEVNLLGMPLKRNIKTIVFSHLSCHFSAYEVNIFALQNDSHHVVLPNYSPQSNRPMNHEVIPFETVMQKDFFLIMYITTVTER
jgi:hypothetical protein